ncbi:MAG: 1-acyl-sn-glycerol-3-phosphate acyltransferase [Myxococcales bacterium]|nr:1-acyl-sn-glycerol-3-phosphate acyltransferase [Myxococcales bacterium]MCB9579259.1 1-acyl-sn-glycerol-3-phosphate acyltransferase [Polyangiaceae bacterium]
MTFESFAAWRARAEKYFDRRDWWRLGPGAVLRSTLRLAVSRDTASGRQEGIDDRDPDFVDLACDLFEVVGERYFRWEVHGVHHVPAKGAALLVGSHNGGIITIDSLLTIAAIRNQYGVERAVHPLAHDVLFQDERVRELSIRFGTLRAGQAGAAAALQAGRLVLVYPGSDYDSTRPFRDRHRIELGGRTGFLELALRERVPIVPVVSVGTHEQLIVLTRGDRLAKLLGLKKLFRADVMPIALALPWGISSGLLPYFPLPAQTTIAFGEPLSWPDLGPEHAKEPAVLARCYREVEQRLQRELDDISRGRIPFLGRR